MALFTLEGVDLGHRPALLQVDGSKALPGPCGHEHYPKPSSVCGLIEPSPLGSHQPSRFLDIGEGETLKGVGGYWTFRQDDP